MDIKDGSARGCSVGEREMEKQGGLLVDMLSSQPLATDRFYISDV
jgi:hypothetical protein